MTPLSSVRGRIIAGFGLLVLIFAVVMAGSAWQEREHRSHLAEMETHATISSLLASAKFDTTSAALLLQRYLVVGDETLVPVLRSTVAVAVDNLEQAHAYAETTSHNEGPDGQAATLDGLLAAIAVLAEDADEIIALQQGGDVEGAAAVLEEAAPAFGQFALELKDIAETEREQVATLRSHANRTADLAFWLLVISGAVGATLALVTSAFIARSILKPLYSLEAAALAVADGDLDARADTTGPRELAHLGESLNRMTTSLLDASKRRELEAERERVHAQLRESEERTRQIVETAQDAFITIDAGGVITAWNAAAETIFGWPREDALGRTLADTIIPPRLRTAHEEGLKRFLATGEGPVLNKRIEITAVHRDGHELPVELAIWAVGSGDTYAFNACIHDISERKRAEEALQRLNQELEADRKAIEELNRSLEDRVRHRTDELRLANEELRQRNRQLLDARAQAATDGLTNLFNHRAFHERIQADIQRAQETGSPVGLIMLDIDGFKRVNDSLGHLAGDQILRGLADTLTKVTKRENAYRYGGDEFAVLMPGADCRKTARVAERLRRAVPKRADGGGPGVTVSLGVACFPDTAESAEELVYGADAAMYWAKSAGKNRVGDWGKLITHREDGTLPWYAADRGVKAPDVVAALVAALAAKDPTTAGHTERCSWYSGKLAQELGLSEEDSSIVRLAALLHDIGKLAVPDEVLCKPGPLTDEEWVQMKQHPVAALHVLAQVRSIADATPAILHHHEHFDGTGYPDGLAGGDIPVASRILLVTDAFDAMTTDRPYRTAMPVEAAIDELKRFSDSQFDPVVVDAFLRVLSRHGAQPLERNAVSQGVPNERPGPARKSRTRATTQQRRRAETASPSGGRRK